MPAPLTAAASLLYGALVRARNAAFDAGVLRTRRVPVPVISVGNLTAGGTGKTPLVEWIARHLSAGDRKVAVLSRGYGRVSRGVVVVSRGAGPEVTAAVGGDEPVELAAALPGVVVVVGERRVDAARLAIAHLGAGVLVLDDGFQHRWLGRDLNIVTVSTRRELRRERLLPHGLLREPPASLERAHLVVLTRADARERVSACVEALRPVWRGPLASAVHAPAGLTTADGAALDRAQLPPGEGFLFAGVADPVSVEETAHGIGFRPLGRRFFPDHHRLDVADVERVRDEARRAGAAFLLTTRKDAVRLRGDDARLRELTRDLPLAVLTMVFRWTSGEDVVRTMLYRAVNAHDTNRTTRTEW
jgi:tetraacyldisaccharide 4'-kinase